MGLVKFFKEVFKGNHLTSSAFTSIVVSLGFFKISELFEFVFSKSAPQFMQVLLIPKFKVPHWLQVFTFDFKELKLINKTTSIKRGIKNISNKRFPIRFKKKLNLKREINIKKIKE